MNRKLIEHLVTTTLVMFFATPILIGMLLMIRWSGDILWDEKAAAWAQVIGSVVALGVAIYIMSRQNRHAARLLLDSDQLAMRRKATAVKAVIEHVHQLLGSSNTIIRSRPRDESLSVKSSRLSMIHKRVSQHERAILSIPAHELGSYHLAKSVHQYAELLVQYRVALENL